MIFGVNRLTGSQYNGVRLIPSLIYENAVFRYVFCGEKLLDLLAELFMLIASQRPLLLLVAFTDESALDGTRLATGFGILIDWHEFLINNFNSARSFLFFETSS